MVVFSWGAGVAGEPLAQLFATAVFLLPLGYIGGNVSVKWRGATPIWIFCLLLPLIVQVFFVCFIVINHPTITLRELTLPTGALVLSVIGILLGVCKSRVQASME